MVRRTASTKKVGKKERPCFERYHGFLPGGWWGYERYHGSLPGGVGLTKIPWVSTRGWWDYERYHGSLAAGGGANKDTMGL